MPIAELCAGYGGLGMAVGSLLQDRIAYVAEIDPHASRILAARYPDAPNVGDITTADWSVIADEVDVVTAGFPCQGISNAGLRKGLADERSGIWRNVTDAIRVIRPRVAFLENVASIRTRGLDTVAADLAAIGYDAEWTSLRASSVGAPHHRDRWFCVAVPEDSDGESFREWWASAPRQTQAWQYLHSGGGGGSRHPHGATLADEACFLLPYSDRLRRVGGAGGIAESAGWSQSADDDHSPSAWWGDFLPVIRRWEKLIGRPAPAPTEKGPRGGIRVAAAFGEWMMGLPQGHVTEVPGLERKHQLRAIGNGVVPQQAFVAFQWLIQRMERKGE